MQRVNRHRRIEDAVIGESYDPKVDREPLPEPPEMTSRQLESMRAKLGGIGFLRSIDEELLTMALRNMTLRKVKAGEIIFRQGERGDHFYLVEEGVFEIYERDDYEEDDLGGVTTTHNIHNACIDEMILLFGEKRQGTLRAATDGKLWELHRRLYTIILVKMSYQRRTRQNGYLEAVNVLAVLNSESLHRCVDAVDSSKYEKGEVIMKEGCEANCSFFIDHGEAELLKESGERIILKRGDYFGEMALLTKTPYDATVVALTDCVIGCLKSERFERLYGKLRKIWESDPQRFRRLCKLELGTETPDESIFR